MSKKDYLIGEDRILDFFHPSPFTLHSSHLKHERGNDALSTGLVLAYLALLGLLYFVGKSFWQPLLIVFKFFFHGALGALGIYLFNLVASNWHFDIPLNPFNSLITGFLGIPGLISLVTLKYWIKI